MSELYVCKQYETPYERVCKIITTLEEHDKQIRADERAKIKTCDGCKHKGKWENEIEYGYPSPCTVCSRRCRDNYEVN